MIYFICWKHAPTEAAYQRKIGLARGIARAGKSVTVLFLMRGENFSEIKNEPNIKYKQLGLGCLHWIKALYLLSSLIEVRIIVKRKDILISLHQPAAIILALKGLKGIKTFLEVNELPTIIYGSNRIGRWKTKQYKKIALKCSGIFVMTNHLKEWHLSFGVEPSKLCVVNMTVDANRFVGLKKESQSIRSIVYCGTATNKKDGICILVDAFGRIANDFKDIHLYIYGNIPLEEDRIVIKNLIERWGIASRIHCKGVVDGKSIPQILTNASLLALARPTSIQASYGFPTKLGEYLLSGNPVVLTNVGEISLFLTDNNSCFFAEPNNTYSFAKKMREALQSPNANEIGLKGKEVAMKNFDSDIEARKMLPFLNSI